MQLETAPISDLSTSNIKNNNVKIKNTKPQPCRYKMATTLTYLICCVEKQCNTTVIVSSICYLHYKIPYDTIPLAYIENSTMFVFIKFHVIDIKHWKQ